jgi:hypothetical protein
MKTHHIFGISVISALLMLACAGTTIAPEEGSLDIKVSIGPICPVEPCTKTDAEKEQIYAAYSLIITSKTNRLLTYEKKASINSILQTMPVGEYEIDISPKNIFNRNTFPITVKVEKGKITSLKIDIDTGIR